MQVTSPYGNTLHHKEHVTAGQFAFTTTEAGNYLACFWIDSGDKGVDTSVSLDWKVGIAAKDWDSVAKKEKIEVSTCKYKLPRPPDSIMFNSKSRCIIFVTKIC